MKKSVILYTKIPQDLKSRLGNLFNLTYFEEIAQANYSDVLLALHSADGIIGSGALTNLNSLLEHAPNLKVISTIKVGYDDFDVEYLTKRKIVLLNTPDVLTDTTADTIFALILATARRVVELNEFIKAGNWKSSIGPKYFGVNVHHKTIGILGMGRIGQAVAKRAHCGFDMKVLYVSNSVKSEAEIKYKACRCSLDELLANSDFVCITLPLTPVTEKLIDCQKLALMKSSAILINGGRGKIIDEAALIEALQKGIIHAAGLDVFEVEPLDANSPLLQMPNVVALPHIGSATHETRYNMAECAVTNLIAALEGRSVKNIVNPSALLNA